jgi:hypothetical protein
MDTSLKNSIWLQFGAAMDMYHDALKLCPDRLWTAVLWDDEEDPRYGQVWYIAYHTMVWTDLFLGGDYESFKPPAPFIRGKLPEQPYTYEDVLNYFLQLRRKAQSVIEGLTDETANRICKFNWMEPSFLGLQLYSMRHIQEHGAQLNFFLGQNGVTGQDWVAQARETVS